MGISIHALLAESDRSRLHWASPGSYFYPRSPCGERPAALTRWASTTVFLSTLSLRRATGRAGRPPARLPDFYPRSPCGERPFGITAPHRHTAISIHALLAESDKAAGRLPGSGRISIHALLAESDRSVLMRAKWAKEFLSTLSLRRATLYRHRPDRTDPHFYPRSPCGERHVFETGLHGRKDFYPRSPCGERRQPGCDSTRNIVHFYPRSPCGERQQYQFEPKHQQRFLSTLSLRRATGGNYGGRTADDDFYPRSPCGERPEKRCKRTTVKEFLSTLSLRRATPRGCVRYAQL